MTCRSNMNTSYFKRRTYGLGFEIFPFSRPMDFWTRSPRPALCEATTFEIYEDPSPFGMLIITAQIAYWEERLLQEEGVVQDLTLSAVYRVADALDNELQRSLCEENKGIHWSAYCLLFTYIRDRQRSGNDVFQGRFSNLHHFYQERFCMVLKGVQREAPNSSMNFRLNSQLQLRRPLS